MSVCVFSLTAELRGGYRDFLPTHPAQHSPAATPSGGACVAVDGTHEINFTQSPKLTLGFTHSCAFCGFA